MGVTVDMSFLMGLTKLLEDLPSNSTEVQTCFLAICLTLQTYAYLVWQAALIDRDVRHILLSLEKSKLPQVRISIPFETLYTCMVI